MTHDLKARSHYFTAFSDGFYHLDQKSMTGITVGVCIALICIIICAFIIVCRGKNRYSFCLNTGTPELTVPGNRVQHRLLNNGRHLVVVTSCLFPSRKFSAIKTQRESVNTPPSATGHLSSERQAEDADVTMPMMSQNHFIDSKVFNTSFSLSLKRALR